MRRAISDTFVEIDTFAEGEADTLFENDTEAKHDSDADSDAEFDTGVTSTEDLTMLAGKTFVLAIEPDRDWVLPSASIGADIGRYVPTFAFEITGIEDMGFDAILGTVIDGAQDLCSEGKPVSGTVDADLKFSLDATAAVMVVAGPEEKAAATVTDIALAGTFSADGTSFIGTFNAILDARDVAHLFSQLVEGSRTPEGVCETVNAVSGGEAPCIACSDGQPYCIEIAAKNVEGRVEDLPIEALAAEDIDMTGCLE